MVRWKALSTRLKIYSTMLKVLYMQQIHYATTLADFCLPFVDPSRIFCGHIVLYLQFGVFKSEDTDQYAYAYYMIIGRLGKDSRKRERERGDP